MSPKLPALSAPRLITILRKHGFREVRQSGSHVVLRHDDGRRTTVPVHSGRDLGKGLLRKILRDANLEVEDLAR
ncbi:MAG: type II toxin-antitoxin system HicA family toxin [Acidobacteriota bacterium]|nr:type II toxin-antitoxin system HicA family toxin [Acidobacteriota bacterium]MDQ5871071.1 type II toxin-antitoxin system HicA family toxin [Acidobacteriota bacterium]